MTTVLVLVDVDGLMVESCRLIYVLVGHEIPFPLMFAAHIQQCLLLLYYPLDAGS